MIFSSNFSLIYTFFDHLVPHFEIDMNACVESSRQIVWRLFKIGIVEPESTIFLPGDLSFVVSLNCLFNAKRTGVIKKRESFK